MRHHQQTQQTPCSKSNHCSDIPWTLPCPAPAHPSMNIAQVRHSAGASVYNPKPRWGSPRDFSLLAGLGRCQTCSSVC